MKKKIVCELYACNIIFDHVKKKYSIFTVHS